MTPVLLTRQEAAAALRVSLSTIDRMRASGELTEVTIGRRRLIPATEIRVIATGGQRRRNDKRPRTLGVSIDGPLW